MNNHIKVLITLLGLYTINFIFLPCIFTNVIEYRINTAALISTISFTIIGMVLLTDKMRYWLLSDAVCFLLAMVYHKPGIYGIGIPLRIGFPIVSSEPLDYNRSIAWVGILLCVIEFSIIQFVVWVCLKLFKLIFKKF